MLRRCVVLAALISLGLTSPAGGLAILVDTGAPTGPNPALFNPGGPYQYLAQQFSLPTDARITEIELHTQNGLGTIRLWVTDSVGPTTTTHNLLGTIDAAVNFRASPTIVARGDLTLPAGDYFLVFSAVDQTSTDLAIARGGIGANFLFASTPDLPNIGFPPATVFRQAPNEPIYGPISMRISGAVIPEPTTATMLGLGLCGLAVSCRRGAKRGTVAMLLGLLIAFYSAPADATVSLSLSANGDFTPGSVITLETRVTANGGEKDDVVFGAILYPGSQVDPGLQSQNLLPDGWIFTATLSCTTVRCIAFLQINPTIPLPPPNVSDFLIAVTPFTIQPDEVPGTVITFNWQSTPSFQRLDFFGITSHPGISITVVPEPTTAALLAASLLAVGMAARRRG